MKQYDIWNNLHSTDEYGNVRRDSVGPDGTNTGANCLVCSVVSDTDICSLKCADLFIEKYLGKSLVELNK